MMLLYDIARTEAGRQADPPTNLMDNLKHEALHCAGQLLDPGRAAVQHPERQAAVRSVPGESFCPSEVVPASELDEARGRPLLTVLMAHLQGKGFQQELFWSKL